MLELSLLSREKVRRQVKFLSSECRRKLVFSMLSREKIRRKVKFWVQNILKQIIKILLWRSPLSSLVSPLSSLDSRLSNPLVSRLSTLDFQKLSSLVSRLSAFKNSRLSSLGSRLSNYSRLSALGSRLYILALAFVSFDSFDVDDIPSAARLQCDEKDSQESDRDRTAVGVGSLLTNFSHFLILSFSQFQTIVHHTKPKDFERFDKICKISHPKGVAPYPNSSSDEN